MLTGLKAGLCGSSCPWRWMNSSTMPRLFSAISLKISVICSGEASATACCSAIDLSPALSQNQRTGYSLLAGCAMSQPGPIYQCLSASRLRV
jgi:hypothetical protein